VIYGTIKKYDEPEKVKKNSQQERWDFMYEGWNRDGYSNYNWQEKDNELQAHINKGTLKGLKVDARVMRTSGSQGIGTITRIHRTHTMAWNGTSHTLEPFTVTWDNTGLHTGGTFDYSEEDIQVAPQIPSIYKKKEVYESVHDLY